MPLYKSPAQVKADLAAHKADLTIHYTMLDEDDFASDSDTKAATQQSIKKYVDDNDFWIRTGTELSPKTTGDDLRIDGERITLDATGGELVWSSPTTDSLLINNGTIKMTGVENFALGRLAMTACTSGQRNIAIGRGAMYLTQTGSYNVALGRSAMYANRTGQNNVSIGSSALQSTISGQSCVAIGVSALQSALLNRNVAIGYKAGKTVSGSDNVLLGNQVAETQTAISNELWIANTSTETPLLHGKFDDKYLKINGGFGNAIRTETTDYTALPEDGTICADGTSNTVTITLPAAPNTGQIFNVACMNSTFTVDVDFNSKLFYDSSSNETLFKGENLKVQYNGTVWVGA